MDKERKKELRRKLGWFFIRTIVPIINNLSLRCNYFIGKVLGAIAYLSLRHHRKVALGSLSTAFPQMTMKHKKNITRNFFIFMAQGSFELLYFLRNPSELDSVSIEGQENLTKALAKNKGLIILTAHLGNFPLLSLKLANIGLPVNLVVRPMRDVRADKYFYNLRDKAGVRTIYSYPRKDCISKIIKALRNNEAVIMLMDQNFGTGGVWVKFFGKLAATPVGPIVLALRTKAAVLPTYIYRRGMGDHCLKILPEEEMILTEDKDETLLLNAIKITRMIEGWIREFADQWGWIHRRWKSRPSAVIKNMRYKIEV